MKKLVFMFVLMCSSIVFAKETPGCMWANKGCSFQPYSSVGFTSDVGRDKVHSVYMNNGVTMFDSSTGSHSVAVSTEMLVSGDRLNVDMPFVGLHYEMSSDDWLLWYQYGASANAKGHYKVNLVVGFSVFGVGFATINKNNDSKYLLTANMKLSVGEIVSHIRGFHFR